jgi:hypothetical protein
VALKEEGLYQKIVTDFRQSQTALSELHQEFREYDDFYLAKHWNKERASWRPDPVVNYVAYVVDQKAPQLTNQRPTGLILPTAQDDEEAAKLFTQITDVIAERVDLDSKIDEVVRTGLLLGTGFFRVWWDNSLKGGRPQYDQMGNVIGGNQWVGDVAIDCPDPSNIYPDPAANCIEECRYIIYAVPKTTKWVEEKFGVKVDPEQAFETEIYNRPSVNNSKDRVMFYEYWYRDNSEINCVYAAGGKVVKRINKVFAHGRYPFVSFIAKKNRKSLWGIGEPKNIMANQKLLNKLVEIPTTISQLTSNPIALIDPRSGIDAKKWTNKPGQIWMAKDPGAAVRWLEPPRGDGNIYRQIELLREFIERMGGVYDANTGETPGGVTAAAAIQMLQEQGSIPIKGIARNLYQSIKDVYELMIELVKENYEETRYIRIVGEDGSIEFQEFLGSQYAEIDFDVKVSAGASTPTSKAYVAQLAADLFDRQILLPSEYVELQENLPNKERIVARLREQEQMQQQQAMMGPAQGPDFQQIYNEAPPELQQQMDLMLEQGMNEQQIVEALATAR